MKKDEMDSKLKIAFNDLKNIPSRDPQAAARGRANFLKQALVLRQSVSRRRRTSVKTGEAMGYSFCSREGSTCLD